MVKKLLFNLFTLCNASRPFGVSPAQTLRVSPYGQAAPTRSVTEGLTSVAHWGSPQDRADSPAVGKTYQDRWLLCA